MTDYRSDVSTIIDNDFRVLATQKRPSPSYNNKGVATVTYTTIVTAYVDIQPVDRENDSFVGEEGKVEVYSHIIFCCYDVNDDVLSVLKGDRFYVGSDFYEVKQVVEYDESHLELRSVLVKGKA